MASYSASKHALEGATEALWYEVRPFGIFVSLVQPGFIRSNSFLNVLVSRKARMSEALDGPFMKYYRHIGPFVERLMRVSRSPPDRIAQKIIRLIERTEPTLWVAVTPDAVIFAIARKILPKRFFHKLMFRLLPGSRDWGKEAVRAIKAALPSAAESTLSGKLNPGQTLTG